MSSEALIHAERAVLGAVLLTPSTFDVHAADLAPEAFSHPGYRAAWRAMGELRGANAEVSFSGVTDRLERAGELGSLGGVEGLGALTDAALGLAGGDLSAAVKLIRESALLRGLVEACRWVIDASTKPLEGGAGEFVDSAMERVASVCLGSGEAPYRSSKEVTISAFEGISARIKGEVEPGIPTGVAPIDQALGGMRPGQQIVIAARPSVGKSMLAGQVVLHCARRDVPCIVFAAEMPAEEYTERLLANDGSVPLSIVTGKKRGDSSDTRRMVESAARIGALPIKWHDAGGITLTGIRGRVRRWKADRKLGAYDRTGIIVVDYLQILDLDDARSREQAVAKASRSLKILARETNSVVVLLSQLNRALENRNDPRPTLADLRESGAIEQDADVVIGLHRGRDDNNRFEEKGLARILKNRGGQVGDVAIRFVGKFQRVEA